MVYFTRRDILHLVQEEKERSTVCKVLLEVFENAKANQWAKAKCLWLVRIGNKTLRDRGWNLWGSEASYTAAYFDTQRHHSKSIGTSNSCPQQKIVHSQTEILLG